MQYNILCENTLDCLSNFEVTVIEALFRYLWRLNKVSLGRLFSKKSRCCTRDEVDTLLSRGLNSMSMFEGVFSLK